MKDKPFLDRWTIGRYETDPSGSFSLFGEVYGHPRFPDGRAVVTSILEELDFDAMEAKTQNTHYKLGERSEDTLNRYREINAAIAYGFIQVIPENNQSDSKPNRPIQTP